MADDAERRRLLVESSSAGGWSPLPCAAVGHAQALARRWDVRLAVIDLGAMDSDLKRTYLEFASEVASHDRLAIVTDEPVRIDEEIFAREAGVWAYIASPEWGPGFDRLLTDALAVSVELNPQFPADVKPNPRAGRSRAPR